MFLVWETFFILNCNCLGASKYLNLHWKLHFSAIYSMQNYKTFLPIRLNHSGFSGETKMNKCLDSHPMEYYQHLSVCLTFHMSIYLSVSTAFFSGIAHKLIRIFKNLQSPSFQENSFWYLFFHFSIIYLFIFIEIFFH